jgi:hypothetical protein
VAFLFFIFWALRPLERSPLSYGLPERSVPDGTSR